MKNENDFLNTQKIQEIKKKIWRPLTQEFYDLSTRIAIKTKGIFIIDQFKNKIADLNSSWWVNAHGHLNARISKAIKNQLQKVDSVVFADFLHTPGLELIEKLHQLINKNILKKENFFEKFFFAENGSTAVEIGLKIAHQFNVNNGNLNKNKIISFKNNYHGETFGAMSVGGESGYFNPFKKLFFKVIFLDFPETFIGDDLKKLEKRETKIINKFITILKKEKENISSIIFEPIIQGASGMKMVRVSFLRKIIQIAKENKIIVIFDEVMTGFGRSGEMFAFERILKNRELFENEEMCPKEKTLNDFSVLPFGQDIVPDIVCLSKILTGGFLPFGMVCCNLKIYETFYSKDIEKTFLHSHSYTASPISSACALENLKVFEEEKTINKIQEIEDFLKNFTIKLYNKNLKTKQPLIEKIRFIGGIFAFEINKENFNFVRKKNFSPRELKEVLLQNNIYIRPIDNNVFLIPPYVIKINQLEKYLKKIIKIIYTL